MHKHSNWFTRMFPHALIFSINCLFLDNRTTYLGTKQKTELKGSEEEEEEEKDMAVGRNAAAPLLFLNLIMYFIVLGFASWCINRFINGQTNHPSFGGNGATTFFLTFAILASVVGIVSKFAGGNHIRAWRNDSLAAAGSSSLIAWALTALAFGFACKQIHIGGWRGWRLRILEAFIIILTLTELLYVLLLHAGIYSSSYGPGYRDTDYGMHGAGADPGHKGSAMPVSSRV